MKEIKFNDIALEWLSLRKLYIKHSTFVKYENIINNHILPYFQSYNNNNITNKCIYTFFERKKNEELSSSTLNSMKCILSSIYQYGIENYNLQTINFKQIKITTLPKIKNVLSHEDRNKLIDYVKTHTNPLSIALLLALYGGLRLGEICALKWKHLDFTNQLVHIEGTATRLKSFQEHQRKTEVIILSPKSHTSYREVPIPSFVFQYIKTYISIYNEEDYLLSNSHKIYEPRRLEKNFCKFCHDYDLHCTFHDLRHSYATECVRQNVEIKTLSKILGHSNVSITLNFYVHTSLEQKQKEISKIQTPKEFVE